MKQGYTIPPGHRRKHFPRLGMTDQSSPQRIARHFQQIDTQPQAKPIFSVPKNAKAKSKTKIEVTVSNRHLRQSLLTSKRLSANTTFPQSDQFERSRSLILLRQQKNRTCHLNLQNKITFTYLSHSLRTIPSSRLSLQASTITRCRSSWISGSMTRFPLRQTSQRGSQPKPSFNFTYSSNLYSSVVDSSIDSLYLAGSADPSLTRTYNPICTITKDREQSARDRQIAKKIVEELSLNYDYFHHNNHAFSV